MLGSSGHQLYPHAHSPSGSGAQEGHIGESRHGPALGNFSPSRQPHNWPIRWSCKTISSAQEVRFWKASSRFALQSHANIWTWVCRWNCDLINQFSPSSALLGYPSQGSKWPSRWHEGSTHGEVFSQHRTGHTYLGGSFIIVFLTEPKARSLPLRDPDRTTVCCVNTDASISLLKTPCLIFAQVLIVSY